MIEYRQSISMYNLEWSLIRKFYEFEFSYRVAPLAACKYPTSELVRMQTRSIAFTVSAFY